MTHPYVLGVATFLAFASIVRAQTLDSGGGRQDTPPATASHKEAKKLFSPFPVTHYSGGDVWTRSHLTGDWNGRRTELAEQGLTLDIDVTQIFQVNARGGKSTNNGFAYSGSADYNLTLDTARLGWWPAQSAAGRARLDDLPLNEF